MKNLNRSVEEQIKRLTPLGWCLLFFDDGSWSQDLEISTIDLKKQDLMIKELETYGLVFRRSTNRIVACGILNSIGFVKNFIEPFSYPECMKYKVKV